MTDPHPRDTAETVADLLAAWRVLDAHERAQVIRAVIVLLDERRDLAR